MTTLTAKKELTYLKILFFLFGFFIMSWIPRFPEVKANLGLTNGQFGSLISISAIGSLVSLLTVGHLVHNYGAKSIMRIAVTSIAISLILLTSTHSGLVFLISSVIQGAAISAFHIAVNTQGFSYQDRRNELVITLLSGYWSGGSVVTAMISGLLVDRISLNLHIEILAAVIFVAMFYIIARLNSVLIKPNKEPDQAYILSDLFKGFRIDLPVSGAIFCAVCIEISVGDWTAIFIKEDLGINGGLQTLPYILFTLAMITGRLSIHKLYSKISMQRLMSRAAIISSASFLIGLLLVHILGTANKTVVILILSISFTIAGLGSSFLAPSVMHIANVRSKSPASVVLGQMGAINTVSVFFMRIVIAWTAQATSLSFALIIPALMLLMVPFFAKIFKSV